MAINATDIKLMRPERTTDEADGGGAMSQYELVSGDINGLWDDIPRATTARGGVSLRKLYCAVRSANADKFLGSHAALVKDAAADNVSTLLFSTDDHYDQRADAQDKIEQYVVLGTRSPLRPVGTQREGQTSLVMYSGRESDAPEVGEVIYLISSSDSQPVKITDVAVQAEEFTYLTPSDEYAVFSAYQFTLRISQPLVADFAGEDPAPVAAHDTEVFKTQSNSAAKYYGMRPLSEPATAGERSVTVDSVFQSIIPATTTEAALLDQTPGISQKVVQVAGSTITRSLGTLSGAIGRTLPTAWVPGTLRLTVGDSVYDERSGTLRLVSGSGYLSDVTIEPSAGRLQFTVAGSRACVLTYTPGVAVELTPYTDSVLIGAGNRQLTYTEQLSPAPLPGSLRIDFSYLGRWYSVSDDGTGGLSGAGAAGSVNYTTGSVSVTLPGEPDTGSRMIYTWAQSPFRAAESGGRSVCFDLRLSGNPAAGSATVSWSRGGVDYTATADSSNSLSGGAGFIEGTLLRFTPTSLPSGDVSVSYGALNSSVLASAVSVSQRTGGTLVLDTGQANLVDGSVEFVLAMTYTIGQLVGGTVVDTRFSTEVALQGVAGGDLVVGGVGSRVVGSIDSVAGTVSVDCDSFTRTVTEYVENSGVLGGWSQQTTTKTLRVEAQTVSVDYRSTTATDPATDVFLLSDLSVGSQIAEEPLVPGALVFDLDGDELVDGGDGVLYRNYSLSTGAGLTAGSIDYPGGKVEINYSAVSGAIDSLSGSVVSGVVGVGAAVSVVSVTFRTNASPLRPSGLQFIARRASDGALIRAESDNDGVISGDFDQTDTVTELPQPGVSYLETGTLANRYSLPIVPEGAGAGTASGDVDYSSGVVQITFSQPVILSSLTYNAVAYTTVPQDPDLLGLNPVRLPTNGRVPVFQPGYLTVIHNTATITEASPVAGQVISCGRGDLAQVVISGAGGALLAADQYVVDLAAGSVTLADPFDAVDERGDSLTLPLTISHRIEDMAVLGSVDIGGTLSLLTDLTHDYSVGDSYVSAAVEFGTLQARVTNLFDEQTDMGWADSRQGGGATASFNDVAYPIAIDNLGAVEERWKLRFTSSTGYELIGEQRGVVATGSVNADFSPVNPMTGTPYFTVPQEGWGSGWLTSNVLRFNTTAAAAPVWAIRTVLPDSGDIADDSITVEFRGDAD